MKLSDSLVKLLRKYGLWFLKPGLDTLVGQPAERLKNDAEFSATVATAAWQAAPMQLRLLDPTNVGWDAFMLAVRDRVYETAGGRIALKAAWEREATAVFDAYKGEADTSHYAQPAADAQTSSGTSLVPPSGTTNMPTGDKGEKKPQEPCIGIDLGTTYSVVAHLDSQGRPVSIVNSSGEILTPSVVLFDTDGTVVGKQAVLAATMEPERVADCVKRDMGSKHYRKSINGEYLPPEVISAYILRTLKADAERKLGGTLKKAVITVPAYFDETRRRSTMDAGRLAGLDVLDILNEPTAAAIAYGFQEGYLDPAVGVKGERTLRVLVYDLGGGTFDVTIVEMSGQSFKAIATDGDVRLGGKDWDEKLVDLASERFRQAHGKDPRATPESLQELYQAAESAKKTLSERPKASMIFSCQGTRFKCEVTKQEFEEATAPLLLRTRTTTEIVVLQAGLSWTDVDKVLLVGGSTRMPQVTRMLKELIGKEADRSISADEAVAHGAALYADLLMQKLGLGEGHTEFSIENVNSHSLGVVGVEPGTGRRVNAMLIPKNTPLPHTAARRFKTSKANQPSVKITVLEGESEQVEACIEVGSCIIRGMPPNLPAGWPIEVRYHYRENGRLQVSGNLVGHESAVTTEFVRDNSLSDDDLMLWGESLAAESARQG